MCSGPPVPDQDALHPTSAEEEELSLLPGEILTDEEPPSTWGGLYVEGEVGVSSSLLLGHYYTFSGFNKNKLKLRSQYFYFLKTALNLYSKK